MEKEFVCHCRRLGLIPGSGIFLGRKWQPALTFLPGKIPWKEEASSLQS